MVFLILTTFKSFFEYKFVMVITNLKVEIEWLFWIFITKTFLVSTLLLYKFLVEKKKKENCNKMLSDFWIDIKEHFL